MADAPGSDTFPYVQQCPQCVGYGYHIMEEKADQHIYTWGSADPVRTIRHQHKFKCTNCDGRGRIIPPEWTQDD